MLPFSTITLLLKLPVDLFEDHISNTNLRQSYDSKYFIMSLLQVFNFSLLLHRMEIRDFCRQICAISIGCSCFLLKKELSVGDFVLKLLMTVFAFY